MSTNQDRLEMIVWKINFKNGTAVDLPLKNGDQIDELLSIWMANLCLGQKHILNFTMNDMQLWINPEEFVLASRSILKPKAETPRPSGKVVDINMPPESFQRVD